MADTKTTTPTTVPSGKTGLLGRAIRGIRGFFEPTEDVRARDVVREAPETVKRGTAGILKGIRGFARFGKQAVEEREQVGEEFKQGFRAGVPQAKSLLETTGSVISRRAAKAFKPIPKKAVPSPREVFGFISEKLEKLSEENRQVAAGMIKIEDPRKFSEAIKDPKYVARGVGQNLPNMLAAMGAGLVGGAVAGPVGGVAAGFAVAASLEGGAAYQEAKDFGLSDEEAEKKAVIVGIANGVLEMLPIERLLRRIPGGNRLRAQIVKRITSAVIQGGEEAVTEGIQEIVSNAVSQTYNENAGLFENVPESAFFGGLLGLGTGSIFADPGAGLSVEDVSGIPKELEPLAKEARKYKTAEEFVKAQPNKVYHGTIESFDEFKLQGGKNLGPDAIFVSPQKSVADYYAQGIGKNGTSQIKEGYITGGKIFDYKNPTDVENLWNSLGKKTKDEIMGFETTDYVSMDKIKIDIQKGRYDILEKPAVQDAIKELGYDGFHIRDYTGGDATGIFNPDILKTKSQLTDIWNKATQKTGDAIYKSKQTLNIPLTKESVNKVVDGRPAHQFLIEDAVNAKDYARAEKILELIPESDPYKETMESYLRPRIEESKQVAKPKKKDLAPDLSDTDLGATYKPTFATQKAFERSLVKNKVKRIAKKTIDKAKSIYDEKVSKVRDAKEILRRRRNFIKTVQKQFGISDADLRQITRRDIRLMTDIEFKRFLDDIQQRSEAFAVRRQAQNQLEHQIREKNLNIEPLRQAMGYPKIKDMTVAQLIELDRVLEPYKRGDVFLSKRKLETINRTELDGIRTYREARERLAKKLNVPVEKLEAIRIGELDRFRGPSGLAEQNPFFRMMVEETAKLRLIREAEYLEMEQKTNELAKKLKTTFTEKFIPQQKNIVSWFDAKDKSTVRLTEEETPLVKFMQEEWIKALDYLVKEKALTKGIKSENYFAHIRRGVLEAVKEDGVVQAFKEVFDQYRLDEQGFNIVDRETGEIFAYDKFFRFAMHRTGQLTPTKNVVGAFLTYMRTFKKKQALDEMAPLLMTYAQALTPKGVTKKGLLLHADMIRFVKEWLNTQKGRRITLVAKQGGKIDWALRAARTFTTLLDLGLNIPVTVATQVGEQAVTYQLLGKVAFMKAKLRALTPRGKRITKKYQNFIGKSPWKQIAEPARNAGDRLSEGLFLLFQDANVRRARNFLLGSMTKEEWQNETVSPERLAQLRIEMGRYGMVEDARSIIGKTPEAGVFTQYKTWALPIMGTALRNTAYLAKYIATLGKLEGPRAKRAALETYRAMELIGIVGIIYATVGPGDDEDDSMLAKMKRRAYQEATTIIQAVEPKMFLSATRLQSFLSDIGNNLRTLYFLERYEQSKFGEYEQGDLKGLHRLKRQFTPRAIRQFDRDKQKELQDVKGEILKGIEEGTLTIAAAKEKYMNEVDKIERREKDKRFKLGYDEYRQDMIRRIESKEISVKEAKVEFADYLEKNKKVMEGKDERTFIDKVLAYAKAIGTDPVTAFALMFQGEIIRRTDNGAIIVERMPLEESQRIRKERGATKELVLDHYISLSTGGTNAESNLRLVTVEEWERSTPIETMLGYALRSKIVDKRTAQKLLVDFKEYRLSEQEVQKAIVDLSQNK